ncbi:hypothetical protein SISNIDRAFT_540987 [Sistotremastrum niveocremeum HHB9708]|uniref:Uncharacterized protein n=1 Tax=Sistotremastrum niveocremeum HHB9708 TaxID=1314777 RepID=A0A164MNU4_9AGAM|nr:hypothetical protein SISNIDRAFT_540987 [Sistotremastrum niveocremeum HHB9708]
MFSKLAVAFIAALASNLAVVNAQGGIVEVGTLTEFNPEIFTCESAAGTGPNIIAVSPALLQEFTCGHSVRVIFGTGSSVVTTIAVIGALDTSLTGGNIFGTPGVFSSLGLTPPGPFSITWEP